jgi:hypothetical protein
MKKIRILDIDGGFLRLRVPKILAVAVDFVYKNALSVAAIRAVPQVQIYIYQ